VWAFEAREMFADRLVRASARRLGVGGDDAHWHRIEDTAVLALSEFDAVLMRKDPPFDQEYLYATLLLSLAEQQGARVVNRAQALRDFNEKLAILRFAEWAAPTLVSSSLERLNAFVEEQRDVIVKKLDGMGGTAIFRVRHDDPNRNAILEVQTRNEASTVMAQRYIPQIVEGDKRVLVIDGKVVPHCLARIPKAGETRGNLAAGGRGVARPLSKRDRDIAEALGPTLRAEGLIVVGLDIIGDYLTEVNVTSPTCMVEIHAQTGTHAAAAVIDALERIARQSP
jgi:glutathione synthase